MHEIARHTCCLRNPPARAGNGKAAGSLATAVAKTIDSHVGPRLAPAAASQALGCLFLAPPDGATAPGTRRASSKGWGPGVTRGTPQHAAAPIAGHLQPSDHEMRLSVQNVSPAIPPELQGIIFHPLRPNHAVRQIARFAHPLMSVDRTQPSG